MSKHKNLIAVLLIVVLSLALAACNAATPSAAGPAAQSGSTVSAGGITVVGQGTAYGQPDQATVVVGVDTFAETVGEATAQNQTTLDNVMAALAAAGIANEDIQTTNYSLYAEQVYGDNGPEGIAGYRVSNQVNVKIRDISLVGDVLGAVTEAGANAIYGVNFSVADPAALEAEARALAMQDAAERAASLAELGNVTLGNVTVISEVVGQPVTPLGMGGGNYAMEQAASAPGISPGQLSYQVQVQVTYGIGG
ncbi:MAG: SIMPL domain-containing protein [Anaerolineae bacterium]|jgi:uncharacterized protein YggE|nr:SIMPL domain-containing protein [Anaerolineae bacterium]